MTCAAAHCAATVLPVPFVLLFSSLQAAAGQQRTGTAGGAGALTGAAGEAEAEVGLRGGGQADGLQSFTLRHESRKGC